MTTTRELLQAVDYWDAVAIAVLIFQALSMRSISRAPLADGRGEKP